MLRHLLHTTFCAASAQEGNSLKSHKQASRLLHCSSTCYKLGSYAMVADISKPLLAAGARFLAFRGAPLPALLGALGAAAAAGGFCSRMVTPGASRCLYTCPGGFTGRPCTQTHTAMSKSLHQHSDA